MAVLLSLKMRRFRFYVHATAPLCYLSPVVYEEVRGAVEVGDGEGDDDVDAEEHVDDEVDDEERARAHLWKRQLQRRRPC